MHEPAGGLDAALQAALAAFRAGDHEAAAAGATRALAIDAEEPRALHLLGVLALAAGRSRRAAALITRALARRPDDRSAIANLGIAQTEARAFAAALATFARGAPWTDRPDVQLEEATALVSLGRLDEAAALLAALIARDPELVGAHYQLGRLEALRGRDASAMAAFMRVAALRPDLAAPHAQIAELLRGQGERAGAEQALRDALARAPTDIDMSLRLAALQTLAGRDDEAAETVFGVTSRHPTPLIQATVKSDRLIAAGRIDAALAAFEATRSSVLARVADAAPPPQPPLTGGAMTEIVLHGQAHLAAFDLAELAAACGCPVRLADFEDPDSIQAAPGSMLLYADGVSSHQYATARAAKARWPGALLVAWLFDNHHHYLWNAVLAAQVDVVFPAHSVPAGYLGASAPVLGRPVPLCVTQWTRNDLAACHARARGVKRGDALSGHYAYYAVAQRRNRLLAALMRDWPEADLSLRADRAYHDSNPETRFLTWRRFKTSLALPVAGDVSMRVFDALAAGQVPIVPRDVGDLDAVIPPADQSALPIIRLDEDSVAAVRAAHRAALAAFDRDGETGADRRHDYVVERHMLANRLSLIAAETARLFALRRG